MSQSLDPRLSPYRPRGASARHHNATPVRFEGHPTGPLAGVGRWVMVPDFEHATLCRAFNLDPVRFYFSMPSSVRGIGGNQVGGGSNGGRRRVNGFVFMAGRNEPVAKLSICFDSERFFDGDPNSVSDFEDLNRS